MTNWERLHKKGKESLCFTISNIFSPVGTGAPYLNFALSLRVCGASTDCIHLREEIVILLLLADLPLHSFDNYSALAMHEERARG